MAIEDYCNQCQTFCGTSPNGVLIEGTGSILFLFSEYPSQVDYEGTYYAGKYGRLIDKLLTGAGLTREGVTLASVASCLGKAEPSQLLHEELPGNVSNIICFGELSAKYLCGRVNVKKHRGQFTELSKKSPGYKKFMPLNGAHITYGLSEGLTNPNILKVMIQDVVKATSSSLTEHKVEWELWDGQELPDSKIYSFDIETVDEKGKYTELATQCAVYGDTFCYVSHPTFESAAQLSKALVRKLRNSNGVLVGHNSWQFDVPRTRRAGAHLPFGEDTMVLAYLEEETQPRGLETLCVKNLKAKGWKEQFEQPLGTPEFAGYNARDVYYTYHLYKKLKENLGERIAIYDHILKPGFIGLQRMADRGIYISKEAVERVRTSCDGRILQITGSIRSTYGEDFNPGSSAQIAAILASDGIHLPKTEKGNPRTGSEILEGVDHPLVDLILEYRSVSKRLSTYVDNYWACAESDDGRVHATYSILTNTGRTSSKKQNTQNLDRELKSFFSAPPGHAILHADWDAVEFRLAAWCAQEQGTLERFQRNPAWDPHLWFATKFYQKEFEADAHLFEGFEDWSAETNEKFRKDHPEWKDRRQVAKSVNFSQWYLGEGYTIQNYAAGLTPSIHLDIQTCDQLHELWHDTLPDARGWYKQVRSELERKGYVEDAIGARRNYGDFNSLPWKKKFGALREATNFKVQGFAARIALLVLAEFDRLDLPLVNFVHDAFYFEFTSEEEAQKHVDLVRDIMENFPRQKMQELFGIDLNIPLRSTPEVKVF